MGAGLAKSGDYRNSRRKRRRRVATINEYGPLTSRPRPEHTPRYGEIVANHTKYGRALTMVDAYSDTSFVRPSTPNWQIKWEKDMRPAPEHPTETHHCHVKPLPTIEVTDTAQFPMKKPPKVRRTRRRKRGKTSSANKAEGADEEVTDRVEKISVSSKLVDNSKMLHHTDRRTDNYMKYGQQLWNNQPKKTANKQWFLGADAVLKQEIEIVPKRRKSIPVFIPILKSTQQKKENFVTSQQSISRLTSDFL